MYNRLTKKQYNTPSSLLVLCAVVETFVVIYAYFSVMCGSLVVPYVISCKKSVVNAVLTSMIHHLI